MFEEAFQVWLNAMRELKATKKVSSKTYSSCKLTNPDTGELFWPSFILVVCSVALIVFNLISLNHSLPSYIGIIFVVIISFSTIILIINTKKYYNSMTNDFYQSNRQISLLVLKRLNEIGIHSIEQIEILERNISFYISEKDENLRNNTSLIISTAGSILIQTILTIVSSGANALSNPLYTLVIGFIICISIVLLINFITKEYFILHPLVTGMDAASLKTFRQHLITIELIQAQGTHKKRRPSTHLANQRRRRLPSSLS